MVNLPYVSNAEGVCICYLSRVNSVTSLFDVLIHFLEGEVASLRIVEGSNDGSLVFAFYIGADSQLIHFCNKVLVVLRVAFCSGRDSPFFFQFFQCLCKGQNYVGG